MEQEELVRLRWHRRRDTHPAIEATRLELPCESLMAIDAERVTLREPISGDGFAHDDEHRCHGGEA